MTGRDIDTALNTYRTQPQLRACVGTDPNVFYPRSALPDAAHPAQVICETCPVRTGCLEHALATAEPHGIWGGVTEEGRQTILLHRRARMSAGAAAIIDLLTRADLTIPQLCELTGHTRASVSARLHRLQKTGVVRPKTLGGGRGRSTLWTLHPHGQEAA